MSAIDTSLTAPTRFLEAANGIRYAYRRYGKQGGTPLVLLPRFRGDLDTWDPALLDALAAERELILVNNRGVSSTSGSFASSRIGIDLRRACWCFEPTTSTSSSSNSRSATI